jgi:hypothetical protein
VTRGILAPLVETAWSYEHEVTFWTLLGLQTVKSNGWRKSKATFIIRYVKLTCLHVVNVQGGRGGTEMEVKPHSFKTSVRRRRGVSATPRPLYPRKIIICTIY